jgi:hypothetical protein
VAALVFASWMPMIFAMMRLTSAGVELPLALAAFGGEVPHQVFIGVAEDVVALGAVLGEVERRVLEDGDEIGEPVHHLLAGPELGGVVEIGKSRTAVGAGQRGDDLLVDLIADVGLPLSATMSFKLAPGGIVIGA